MARPIKETPVLKGKDAVRFAKKIANPTPVSQSEKDAARKAYEAFKAISTFPM
jgi:nucleoside diphosphate kinase